MAIKTLFFDAAGTLVHLAEPPGATYARIAARYGLETEAEAMNRAFRAAWKSSPAPVHPEGQAPEDDDRGWWRALVAKSFAAALGRPLAEAELGPLFEELYASFAQPSAWRVHEDVLPVLQAVQGRCRLFVLSNFDKRLRTILAGHGLDPWFEGMIISSEVGASKPHPRIFQAALRMAGARPEECLHVGDDARADVEGATAAGMQAYLVERPAQGLEGVVTRI